MYSKKLFIHVMANLNFHQPSVAHFPSEISIRRFAVQGKFLKINVENSCVVLNNASSSKLRLCDDFDVAYI